MEVNETSILRFIQKLTAFTHCGWIVALKTCYLSFKLLYNGAEYWNFLPGESFMQAYAVVFGGLRLEIDIWMWSRCDINQIISCKISYKTVIRCPLMHVLFLRVKLVNQESLEEMECLAKMEFQDYQGSRCVLGCVWEHVWYVLFLSDPCLCHHGVICSSGYCWTSRPAGFKGGAGRQWSSWEGESVPNLTSSLCCKDSRWNWFVFAFIRCDPSSIIFRAWGNNITLGDIVAIFSCRSFDLIRTRVVLFSVFLQGGRISFLRVVQLEL